MGPSEAITTRAPPPVLNGRCTARLGDSGSSTLTSGSPRVIPAATCSRAALGSEPPWRTPSIARPASSAVPSGSLRGSGNRTGRTRASTPTTVSSERSTMAAARISTGRPPAAVRTTREVSPERITVRAIAAAASPAAGVIPRERASSASSETNTKPAPSPACSSAVLNSSAAVWSRSSRSPESTVAISRGERTSRSVSAKARAEASNWVCATASIRASRDPRSASR